MSSTALEEYVEKVTERLWDYAEASLGHDAQRKLAASTRSNTRSPVFKREYSDENLLASPSIDPDARRRIVNAITAHQRHRYFASMRSSQALAQTVFGNLSVQGKQHLLRKLVCDDGQAAFSSDVATRHIKFELELKHLGEPRPTSIDVWIDRPSPIAIECKFTEADFGRCSRPSLRPNDASYERQFCDGSYVRQRGRDERCSLTEIGVRYWQHLPRVFDWDPSSDLRPCPLRDSYQLARNVLAVTSGRYESDRGHVLVIYDANNPSFHEGGAAEFQWQATRRALLDSTLLRRCTWQALCACLLSDSDLSWLVSAIDKKYGFITNRNFTRAD